MTKEDDTRVDGKRRAAGPTGSTASHDGATPALITEEWLRSVGFRKAWMGDQQKPHWLLNCADTRRWMTGSDDLGVELGPPDERKYWENPDEAPKWWCWLRSDFSHSRGRFLFVRYLQTQADVMGLVAGITGLPWNPARHEHGCVRYPGQKMETLGAADAVDPHAGISNA